ncbi:MAG: hypothetical protein FJ150_02745 [Euryarchaeota archaeon]|nr:hypothetical protein [Euryarchaeota archaeon]
MPEEIIEKEEETPTEEVIVEQKPTEEVIQEPEEVLPEAIDREAIDKKQEVIAEKEKEIETKEKEKKLAPSDERKAKIQKEIDRLIWQKKTLAEEIVNLEERKRELETKSKETPAIAETGEFIEAGGKRWYTNVMLKKMLGEGVDPQGNPLTQDMIDEYREARNIAIATDRARKEIREEKEKMSVEEAQKEELRIRQEDAEFVKTTYDDWINDKEDPRYKEMSRIWIDENYNRIPRGLSKAAKEAEENYQKNLIKPDRNRRSEELSVESPTGSPPKLKIPALTEYEKESAHNMFPHLTQAEAEKKYALAKSKRGGK